MKKGFAIVVLLLCSSCVLLAQKQRYSQSSKSAEALQYPLLVHVAHARLMGQPVSVLHLDAVIDGKTVELETGATSLLHIGEYQARLLKDDEGKSGWFSKSYELLFTDGTKVVFSEVAESE